MSVLDYFEPLPEYKNCLGNYQDPLIFDNGQKVQSPEQWQIRRQEILAYWHSIMGPWPKLLTNPEPTIPQSEDCGSFTRHKVMIPYAPEFAPIAAYLLIPNQGKGPFPAVLDLYYNPEPGAGIDQTRRNDIDFGFQLAHEGIVSLCIGTPIPIRDNILFPNRNNPTIQPLSFMTYIAANCHTLLSNLPYVNKNKIGVVGHSMGGKWAMFASCLYEPFACGVWSDPGIVFEETHPDINYWEPWYLGYEPAYPQAKGFPFSKDIRTGAYKTLMENGHNLVELHALMAPRPFLVSGGDCDRKNRWEALNYTLRINQLLGYSGRVGMTNRPTHKITPEDSQSIIEFLKICLLENRFNTLD